MPEHEWETMEYRPSDQVPLPPPLPTPADFDYYPMGEMAPADEFQYVPLGDGTFDEYVPEVESPAELPEFSAISPGEPTEEQMQGSIGRYVDERLAGFGPEEFGHWTLKSGEVPYFWIPEEQLTEAQQATRARWNQSPFSYAWVYDVEPGPENNWAGWGPPPAGWTTRSEIPRADGAYVGDSLPWPPPGAPGQPIPGGPGPDEEEPAPHPLEATMERPGPIPAGGLGVQPASEKTIAQMRSELARAGFPDWQRASDATIRRVYAETAAGGAGRTPPVGRSAATARLEAMERQLAQVTAAAVASAKERETTRQREFGETLTESRRKTDVAETSRSRDRKIQLIQQLLGASSGPNGPTNYRFALALIEAMGDLTPAEAGLIRGLRRRRRRSPVGSLVVV